MPDIEIQPLRESNRALFRAHATARLRGDATGALELALQIGEGRRMAHLLYVLYLFTRTVYDEFGDAPDPSDLAELTKRLHERHFWPGSEFRAIRAEAMVRGVCGESVLLTEVPVAEQPTYMWAVIADLADPQATDAEIAACLDRAEALGTEIVGSGWDALFSAAPGERVEGAPCVPPVSPEQPVPPVSPAPSATSEAFAPFASCGPRAEGPPTGPPAQPTHPAQLDPPGPPVPSAPPVSSAPCGPRAESAQPVPPVGSAPCGPRGEGAPTGPPVPRRPSSEPQAATACSPRQEPEPGPGAEEPTGEWSTPSDVPGGSTPVQEMEPEDTVDPGSAETVGSEPTATFTEENTA